MQPDGAGRKSDDIVHRQMPDQLSPSAARRGARLEAARVRTKKNPR
jgi:hypothetical protein